MSDPTSPSRRPDNLPNQSRVEYLILLRTIQKLVHWHRSWLSKEFVAVSGDFRLTLRSDRPGKVRLAITDSEGSFPMVLDGEYAQRLWCLLTKTKLKPKLSSLKVHFAGLRSEA